MDSKVAFLALLLLLGSLRATEGKPISLTYRCPCRYFESNVAKSHIKHLKILTVPGCSLQIIARLKNSSKQICIDPKLKWIHEYLEKYLHKGSTAVHSCFLRVP
uniref:Stromal cell-derived factor 1 n=1 Tax=Salvator merianae TaxID=96440 RepID=A0A8D0B865_SALMN